MIGSLIIGQQNRAQSERLGLSLVLFAAVIVLTGCGGSSGSGSGEVAVVPNTPDSGGSGGKEPAVVPNTPDSGGSGGEEPAVVPNTPDSGTMPPVMQTAPPVTISAASLWPLAMLNATVAHAQGYTGKGVTVGVIDSGVDVEHWELAGKVVNPSDARDERLAPGKIGTVSHGTGVAGVIVASSLAPPATLSATELAQDTVGIAPDAKLYVVSSNSSASLSTSGSDRAYFPTRLHSLRANDDFYAQRFGRISEHVSIINNSFGFTGLISEWIYAGGRLTGALAKTVMTITQDGVDDADKVLYVWAAGNNHGRKEILDEMGTTGSFDASSPSVLAGLPYHAPRLKKNTVAVVAVRPNGQIASYSNRCGVAADFCIAAPGGDVSLSESIRVPSASRDEKGEFRRSYTLNRGTSIAAPYVSGALAILMEAFPSLGATEVLARLLATADKSGIYATATIYGQGLVDLQAAVKQVGDTSLLTSANLQGMRWPVADSSLEAAAAFGDALIESLRGVSVAAYDDLDAPFAVALDRLLVEDDGSARPVAIDALNAPALPMWGERTHAVGPASDGWFGLAAGGLLPGSLPRAAFAQPYLDLLPERAVGAGVQMNQDRRRLRAATFLAPGEDSGEPAAAAVAFEYAPTGTGLGGYQSGSGWLLHAGALAETARFLGGSSKGAFGSLRATSLFAGLAGSAVLAGSWSVHGRADAGVSRPKSGGGIVRRIGPAVTSSWALGISSSDILRRGDSLGLVVSQPLRAESGSGMLEVSVGRTRYRQVLVRQIEFALQPSGRQIDGELFYVHPLGNAGRLRAGIGISRHPGHSRSVGHDIFGQIAASFSF